MKLGGGTLEVKGDNAYSGKTIVSNGTLKVAFKYYTEEGLTGRMFEAEAGANLEVTMTSHLSNRHASESSLLNIFPDGSTLSFIEDDTRGMPRFTNAATLKGTVNFLNDKDNTTSGGGFVGSVAELGSNDIDWGILGAPETLTRVFDIESVASGGTIYFGNLRMPSQNAEVYMKRKAIFKVGALGKEGSVNGTLLMGNNNDFTWNQVGGKMTFGNSFKVVTTGSATFNFDAGEVVNNANLSDYTVSLADGVTLSGAGTWPANMMLPASYQVAAIDPVDGVTPPTLDLDVDFSKATLDNLPTADTVAALDTEKTYTIFAAKSITNWTTQEIKDDGHGKWKVVKQGSSLVLKYAKASFVVSSADGVNGEAFTDWGKRRPAAC